jgi:hypothetical protein
MPYNKGSCIMLPMALTFNLYAVDPDYGFVPPSGYVFIIDNSGAYIIDNGNNFLIATE